MRLDTIDTFFENLASTSGGNLVLKFLAAFARFEYALKRAGYLTGDEKRCDPNWTRFQVDHDSTFRALSHNDLDGAKAYLADLPPKKLIITDMEMTWSEGLPSEDQGSLTFYAVMVRRVRNNLFHGEKTSLFIDRYGVRQGPAVIGEPSRNELLLQYSLVLLESFLKCSPKVRSIFSNYIPDD